MVIRSLGLVELVLLCTIPFFTALVVAAVTAYLVSRRPAPAAGGSSGALEILKERFARGELTHEQYEEMRRALEQ